MSWQIYHQNWLSYSFIFYLCHLITDVEKKKMTEESQELTTKSTYFNKQYYHVQFYFNHNLYHILKLLTHLLWSSSKLSPYFFDFGKFFCSKQTKKSFQNQVTFKACLGAMDWVLEDVTYCEWAVTQYTPREQHQPLAFNSGTINILLIQSMKHNIIIICFILTEIKNWILMIFLHMDAFYIISFIAL